MKNFQNKIVMITGANSGIGRACAEQFAALGSKLIVTARKLEDLKTLQQELSSQFNVSVLSLQLDVRDAAKVQQEIAGLPESWQSIDVLVNNAGLSKGLDKVQDGKAEDWDLMIDTNVKGLLHVSRAVLPLMVKHNKGHVINIGSISSHQVYSGGAVYCATKHAVKAISEGIKMDVHGTPIRVSSVDPGMVKTNFSNTRFDGDNAKADAVYEGVNYLVADDIADAVVYCATRPAHVDIREIKIYPTDQTAAHMVHRRKNQ